MDFPRQIARWALDDGFLHRRMSFIAGPRQIGKTTLVRRHLEKLGQPQLYYNWDTPSVKRNYAANPSFFIEDIPQELARPWIALDEIHKYPKWKNILKGYYDEWKERMQFVITGSARLELFRRSGDSLVGRYFLYRMLPMGVREMIGALPLPERQWNPGRELPSIPRAPGGAHEAMSLLLNTTGFPEPLSVGTAEFCHRWRGDHVSLLVHEDLRDITRISEIAKLETLLYLLPDRVGSPLSLNALRAPLECAHGSLTLWLLALKKVYLIFSLPPWTTRLSRSVRKEEKYYFWDWGMVESPGERFENFVAVSLERSVAAWNEWGVGPFKLYYVRTKDGLEVDFAIADRRRVRVLVEAKWGDPSVSKGLLALKDKLGAPLAFQVVGTKQLCVQKGPGVFVIGADRLLSLLA